MKLEMEQLRLRLIETQMALLRYQHREVTDAIERIQNQSKDEQMQRQFDAAVDARDMPSGVVSQPDPYAGD